MSNRPRLRFLCRGTAQVADPNAQLNGNRRCIGRRWQEVVPGTWSWCPTDKADETDYHPDLVQACKEGDLWAADDATAKACGVAFDPTFGGETTQTIKDFKAQQSGEAPKAEEPVKKSEQSAKAGGKGEV
jgi:hypothetical protein